MIKHIEKRRKTFQVSMTIIVDEDINAKYPLSEANVENILCNDELFSLTLENYVDIEDVSARLLGNEIILTDEEYEDGTDSERR